MEEQSDTPRVDAVLRSFRFIAHTDRAAAMWLDTVINIARDLERELATATRERDEARISVAMLWAAAKLAESALADIGDSDHEPTDDLAWCELRAQRTLPVVRFALAATEPKP